MPGYGGTEEITAGVRLTHFSRVLRDTRRDCGLTQRELGEAIGVSRTAIAHFENGRATPTLPHIYGLLAVLGLTADELLGAD